MQKLEAINKMLVASGLSSVSSLEDNQHPAVLDALVLLEAADKLIQGKGWYFNTDYNLTLSYNSVNGEVTLPSTTLAVDPCDTTYPYIQRGNRLYDRVANTYNIGKNIDVTLIQQLAFDELPENAAIHISDVAARDYVADKVGDTNKGIKLNNDVKESYSVLHAEDIKFNNIKLSDNPVQIAVRSGIIPSW